MPEASASKERGDLICTKFLITFPKLTKSFLYNKIDTKELDTEEKHLDYFKSQTLRNLRRKQ
jgi:hypothetical protein